MNKKDIKYLNAMHKSLYNKKIKALIKLIGYEESLVNVHKKVLDYLKIRRDEEIRDYLKEEKKE